MANPLNRFVAEGRRLTDLGRGGSAVPAAQLSDFMANQKRIEFLQDLIAQVAIVAHCYDACCTLTDRLNDLERRIRALPPDPGTSDTRTIPQLFVDEEERLLVEADSFTSLIYYEVTSLVHMLRQLDVIIDPASEVQYLVKIRDRFLSHVQLSGVTRGPAHGLQMPEQGFLQKDVVSLNIWSSDKLRFLGEHALPIGSPAWQEQQRRNEQLVLSKKRNKDFTQNELLDLMAAGVRECRLELALQQLGELLERGVLPIIEQETGRAIKVFGYERWSELT